MFRKDVSWFFPHTYVSDWSVIIHSRMLLVLNSILLCTPMLPGSYKKHRCLLNDSRVPSSWLLTRYPQDGHAKKDNSKVWFIAPVYLRWPRELITKGKNTPLRPLDVPLRGLVLWWYAGYLHPFKMGIIIKDVPLMIWGGPRAGNSRRFFFLANRLMSFFFSWPTCRSRFIFWATYWWYFFLARRSVSFFFYPSLPQDH